MCRLYSTRSGTRRWPMAVYYNILDIAVINSWVLYKEVTKSKISRRSFMLKLIMELCGVDEDIEENRSSINHVPVNLVPTTAQHSTKKRKHCQATSLCQFKTFNRCYKCQLMTCKQCEGTNFKAVVCKRCQNTNISV
jgi:hypothetical protein